MFIGVNVSLFLAIIILIGSIFVIDLDALYCDDKNESRIEDFKELHVLFSWFILSAKGKRRSINKSTNKL